jgi:pimeloyl-ACP methyl ester carboxylesterase
MDILRVTITGPPARAAACGIHAAARVRCGIVGSTTQRQTESGGRSIMESIKTIARQVAAALGVTLAVAGGAQAQTTTVGTSFPAGFVAGMDASLNKPWIGFGGAGPVTRTPVIFLHGNDDTPFYGGLGRTGVNIHGMAQAFANAGWASSELWALGWQGDQSDQTTFGWTKSASAEHSIAANVPDLRAFVASVLAYTGASKVDIVAHGMGVVLAREWVRQDRARQQVRRLVAIEGPNAGMLMCADYAGNPWSSPFAGGYGMSSPVCQELGSPNTALLQAINNAKDGSRILPKDILVIRNGDMSYPYMTVQDGGLTPSVTTAVDMYGVATDFTYSASIPRARELTLTGQGVNDLKGGAAHAGIANSTVTHAEAISFLMPR